MAKLEVKHINYVFPGEKETIINLDVGFTDGSVKNMTFVTDTERDQDGNSVNIFLEVNANNFNNRHAMLIGQHGNDEVIDKNDEQKRGINIGRALYDIKDVALKSAVASQIIDPNQKEAADVDDGFIEIYAPHTEKNPLGFCQVKNYSFGLSDKTKIGPVLHQTDIKKRLQNSAGANDTVDVKQNYSYYLNPRNKTELEDQRNDYDLEIKNTLPTYTYVPLSSLSIPETCINTLGDLIGSPMSVLLSASTERLSEYSPYKGKYVSPFAKQDETRGDYYILSAPGSDDFTTILSVSVPLNTKLSRIQSVAVTEFAGERIVNFGRKPISYFQYIQSFKELSTDIISDLIIPQHNYEDVDHNYIYEIPLNKSQYNKYELGLVQGDMVVGKNAYDYTYSTQISSIPNLDNIREYIGIGAKGGKIFLKYLDDVDYCSTYDYSLAERQLMTRSGIDSQLTSHMMEPNISQKRTYQKVEVLDTINRFMSESKHKANIFTVNVHGIANELSQIEEKDGKDRVDQIKNDIKNSIMNIVKRLTPAHTQMFNVAFSSTKKDLTC